METKKVDIVQSLMDSAYATWEGKGWSREEFLYEISSIERKAVVLGNLNYQVHNGGFVQWVDNNYRDSAMPILRMIQRDLERMEGGEFPALRKAVAMALEVRPMPEDDVLADRWAERLSKQDNEFYALDNLLEEMDAYMLTLSA